jgi:hypothetical protein
MWEQMHFSTSHQETEMITIPRVLLERFTDALCYAAYMDKVEAVCISTPPVALP